MGMDLIRWESEQDLGGVGGGGIINRLHCMEKTIFNLERLELEF